MSQYPLPCSECFRFDSSHISKRIYSCQIYNSVEMALATLHRVFRSANAQKGLIALYSASNSECRRNGKLGMEVGMAREKDQVAVISLFLGDSVNHDIPNDLPEDILVFGEKISIKHSSSKVGTKVKVKWTSENESVEAARASLLSAPDDYYPHLLITYLDASRNLITIIGISSEHNRNTIRSLGESAFHVPGGNSRGIEYSPSAMRELLRVREFTVEIHTSLDMILCPIERRVQMLRDMGVEVDLEPSSQQDSQAVAARHSQ